MSHKHLVLIMMCALAGDAFCMTGLYGEWKGTFWSASDVDVVFKPDGSMEGSLLMERNGYEYFTLLDYDDSRGATFSFNSSTNTISFTGNGTLLTMRNQPIYMSNLPCTYIGTATLAEDGSLITGSFTVRQMLGGNDITGTINIVPKESSETTMYALTVTATGPGQIDPNEGAYPEGSLVTLVATPASGYQVKAWNGTDDDNSTSPTNTVTMHADRQVGVEFEPIPAALDVDEYVHEIQIATSYNFGDGTQNLPFYNFGASLRVNEKVSSVTMLAPNNQIYTLLPEMDDGETWFSFSVNPSNEAGLAPFAHGTFIFTLQLTNGTSVKTQVRYAKPDGSPIEPVTRKPVIRYPLHKESIDPGSIAVLFEPYQSGDIPNHTIGVEVSNDVNDLYVSLPAQSMYHSPIPLAPSSEYEIELTYNHAYWITNEDGIPVVMDKDAELIVQFTTTQGRPDLLTEVERILIELEQEYVAGTSGSHYEFWADVRCGYNTQGISLIDPHGRKYELQEDYSEGGRGFEYWTSAPDLKGLAGLTDGPYTFVLRDQYGGAYSTVVDFLQADGQVLMPISQIPEVTFPSHGTTDVPTILDVDFIAADIPSHTLRLEWESNDWRALAGEVLLAGSTSSYGPILLSKHTAYTIDLNIDNTLSSVNTHGIPTVVRKSAETLHSVTTETTIEPCRLANIEGDYWWMSIYAEDFGYADHAKTEILPAQMCTTSLDNKNVMPCIDVGDTVYDQEGWLHIVWRVDDTTFQDQWATSSSLLCYVYRQYMNDQLGIEFLLKRPASFTREDVIGTYIAIPFEIAEGDEYAAEAGYGKVTLDDDGTLENHITFSGGRIQNESQRWEIDDANDYIVVDGYPVTHGQNGIMCRTWDHPGAYGMVLLVKESENKGLANVQGTWLIQHYSARIDNGMPETLWGTFTIDKDGVYRMHLQSNDGGEDLVTGSVTIEPNGELRLKHETLEFNGVLNETDDTIVFAETGQYGDAGVWVATRVSECFEGPEEPSVTLHRLTSEVLGGPGTLIPSAGFFKDGESVHLSVLPGQGYHVQAWTGTDDDSSQATENTVTMNADKHVTVVLSKTAMIPDPNLLAGIQATLGVSSVSDQDLRNMKRLVLPEAGIVSLEGLQIAESLEYLDVRDNAITSLQPLAGLGSLKVLGLSGNVGVDIGPLFGLAALVELGLQGCGLQTIHPLADLTSLERVNLSENRIQDISALNNKSLLEVLWLNGNMIGSVDPLLGLSGLLWLNLQGNPLTEDNCHDLDKLRSTIETQNRGRLLVDTDVCPN